MQGETLAWLMLAHDLGMPIRELQAKVSSSDFALHCAYLDWRKDNPTITQHYLMLIALEVSRVLAENPGRIKLDAFKLKWVDQRAREQIDPEERTQQSKHFWNAIVSMPQKPRPG